MSLQFFVNPHSRCLTPKENNTTVTLFSERKASWTGLVQPSLILVRTPMYKYSSTMSTSIFWWWVSSGRSSASWNPCYLVFVMLSWRSFSSNHATKPFTTLLSSVNTTHNSWVNPQSHLKTNAGGKIDDVRAAHKHFHCNMFRVGKSVIYLYSPHIHIEIQISPQYSPVHFHPALPLWNTQHNPHKTSNYF